MKDLIMQYLEKYVLEQQTKSNLVNKVIELQERDKELVERYRKLREAKKESDKKYKEEIELYKQRAEDLLKRLVTTEVTSEEYKRVADLKLGNAYNINATWIDKIVFILKEAKRPLRSSEIIEILQKNDISFRTLANPQKGLSTHLTKALKYGRIKGTKLKGQNGYAFELPE